MRVAMAAILAMTALAMPTLAMTAWAAMADDIEEAHRTALTGRDSYWNCLAQEYTQGSNKNVSASDFTVHIANVCPSERQNFRVSLIDYLSMQFPAIDVGDHLTTANKAIALAQADIVNAFIKHKATPK
jgi:hypothetical protein